MAAKKAKTARELVKLGRPKKYTPEGLRRAVEEYFLSLCYLVDVVELKPVILSVDPDTGAIEYQRDEYGHPMKREVPVIGGNDKPLQRLCWISPPGEEDLCMRIGISRDTWDRYAQDENYAEVIALARGRIRGYLEGAAESKGGTGALAKLERIYGVKSQVQVQMTGVEAYLNGLPKRTEW